MYTTKLSIYYLDRDLNCNLYRNPEDVPVYTGHSLLNTKSAVYIVIHCSVIVASQST